jgi:hypothetical protein
VDRHKPTPPIPLSPSRYKLTFTITERVRDKLQEAQDLLRHSIPNGELEQVFERALDLLIAERKKQRFGKDSQATRTWTGARHAALSLHSPGRAPSGLGSLRRALLVCYRRRRALHFAQPSRVPSH